MLSFIENKVTKTNIGKYKMLVGICKKPGKNGLCAIVIIKNSKKIKTLLPEIVNFFNYTFPLSLNSLMLFMFIISTSPYTAQHTSLPQQRYQTLLTLFLLR